MVKPTLRDHEFFSIEIVEHTVFRCFDLNRWREVVDENERLAVHTGRPHKTK